MVCQMISVGETTGASTPCSAKIADFYDDEVDSAVTNLTLPDGAICHRLFGRCNWRSRRRHVSADFQTRSNCRRLGVNDARKRAAAASAVVPPAPRGNDHILIARPPIVLYYSGATQQYRRQQTAFFAIIITNAISVASSLLLTRMQGLAFCLYPTRL